MRRALPVLVAVSGLFLFACEDKKTQEQELLNKVGIEAGAPAASVTGVNVIPPVASSAASTTAKAPPKDCGTGDPSIDDPDLDAELRLKLNKPQGTITSADLATVKSVNLTKKQSLSALDPCVFPKLTNLKFLYLPKGDYYDLTPIANLVHIEGLRIAHSQVADLKQLAKLTVLDQLDLGVTPVRDLTPLGDNNVNITELSLDDTQVTDLGPLAKLTKLEKLSIKNTTVQDVSPLAKLTHLKRLDVAGCALNNVDTLSPLRAHGMLLITK